MRVKRIDPRLPFDVAHLCAVEYDWGSYGPRSPDELGVVLPWQLFRAVPRRKAAFLAGRHCAQTALAEASISVHGGIPIRWDHCPIWPSGATGSITHTDRIAAAAVGPSTKVAALGIDAEPIVTAEACACIREQVSLPGEWESLPRRYGWTEEHFVTLVFSAKEAAFKALYPWVGRPFELADMAVVAVDPAAWRFDLRVVRNLSDLVPADLPIQGRFAQLGTGILTYVEIPVGFLPPPGWRAVTSRMAT